MTDPLKIVNDLSVLAPIVAAKAKLAIDTANQAGYFIRPFETYRSPERQQLLYDKGRISPGSIVTKCKPWQSFHQFSVALDIAFWTNTGWSWDGNFTAVSRFFIEQGFEWLHPFEDVHFQMVPAGQTWEEAYDYVVTQGLGLPMWWDKMGLGGGQ